MSSSSPVAAQSANVLLGAGLAEPIALGAEALLWLELSGRSFGKDVFGFGF